MFLYVPHNKRIYNFSIYQVGYEKCAKNHYFGPVVRDFYVAHFLISGKGEYHIRNKIYRLEKGDIFLVVPNETSFYKADENDPYEYFWIAFSGQCSKDVMTSAGFYADDNFLYRHPEEYDVLYDFFEKTYKCSIKDEVNELTLLGHLYSILGFITKGNMSAGSETKQISSVEFFTNYVSLNYYREISVKNLAEFMGLHRSSLYRLVERVYGISPLEYISNYRLDRALFMLKNSDLNISQIAYACGFDSIVSFNKAFKKKFKKSPTKTKKLV